MPMPMIDGIELKAVQHIRQETSLGFVEQRIAGLEGTLHQKLGRRSFRVELDGCLLPETAADDLATLQDKASKGTEVSFTADITTALNIEKMVIEHFRAEQTVGLQGQITYQLTLVESPPLPPPAEVSAFGGLGDFGLGDLGFDVGALGDVLSEIQDQAGAIMDAVDSALDVVGQLSALASLADIANISNPLRPLTEKVGELQNLQEPVAGLTTALGEIQP
jgi:hypothetical protein